MTNIGTKNSTILLLVFRKNIQEVVSMNSEIKPRQCTSSVIVARPHHFNFNAETADSNLFQKIPKQFSSENLSVRVMAEFDQFVAVLRGADLHVCILDNDSAPASKLIDSLFLNNWFSTNRFGTIQIFPMLAANRRAEVRPNLLRALLESEGFFVQGIVDYRDKIDGILEGTGSIVKDHLNGAIYASLSPRCEIEALRKFMDLSLWDIGYCFETADRSGYPIYHTNVVMSLGREFVVLCDEAIPDPEDRKLLVQNLALDREIITISMAQMEQFCGNLLQLESLTGQSLILMSSRALRGFNDDQILRLEKYARIVSVPIPTIEEIGGGSIRCMLAENFLPRAI